MFGFVSRRRHEQELAAAQTEIAALRRRVLDTEARHDEVEDKRRRLARWLAEADAANRRLAARNLELGNRISAFAESDPEYAAQLEQQVARLTAEVAAETKRADRLQARLDDAVGLTPSGIQDSGRWQPGYQTPKPEVTS